MMKWHITIILTILLFPSVLASITVGPGISVTHGNSTYNTTYNHTQATTYDYLVIGVNSILFGQNNVSLTGESGELYATVDSYQTSFTTTTNTTGYTGILGSILNDILIILLAITALATAAITIKRYRE